MKRLVALSTIGLLVWACSSEQDDADGGDGDGDASGGQSGEGGASGGSDAGSGGAGSGGDGSGGGDDGSGGTASGGGDALGGQGGMGGGEMAPENTVQVRVWVAGLPFEDAPVMISAPDGSFVRTERTDSEGRVTLTDFPVGGYVTAGMYDADRDERFLETRANVSDGNVLHFGSHSRRQTDNIPYITGTAPAPVMPGIRHRIHRKYGSGTIGDSYQLNANDGVLDVNGLFNFVVRTEDSDTKTTAAAAYTGIEFTSMDPFTLNLEAEDFTTDLGTHTFSLDNDTGVALTDPALRLHGYRDGFRYYDPQESEGTLAPGASMEITDKYHSTFFTRVEASLRVEGPPSTYQLYQFHHNTLAPAGAGTTTRTEVDASALPQALDGVVLNYDPMTFDLSAVPQISCEGQAAQALWVRFVADGGHWAIQQPYASSVTLPDIDPALEGTWITNANGVTGGALAIPGGDYSDFGQPVGAYELWPFLDQLPAGTTVCEARVEYLPFDG